MVYRQMFEERQTVIGYSASHDQHCPGPAEEERRRRGPEDNDRIGMWGEGRELGTGL